MKNGRGTTEVRVGACVQERQGYDSVVVWMRVRVSVSVSARGGFLSLTGNERKGLSCSVPSAILFQNFAFSLFFSFFFSFRGWGNELGTMGRGLSCFLAMKDTT